MSLTLPSTTFIRRGVDSLRVALDWWLQALESCIPQKTGQLFSGQHAKACFLVDQDQISVSVNGSEWQPLDPQSQSGNASTRRLMSDAEIVISDTAVFFRTLTLPKNVGGEIRNAIQFQIKQHVPMAEHSIAVGHRINEVTPPDTAISVTIAAVRKDTIQHALAIAESAGYVATKIRTFSNSIPLAVDSVMRAQRARKLAGLVLIGGLVIQLMLIPLLDAQRVKRSNVLLKEELSMLIGKTKVSADLKRLIDQRMGESAFINSQLSQDMFADGLAILSSKSPADVWLSDLQYDGRVFRLTGKAQDAAGWAMKLQQDVETFENVRLENVSSAAAEGEVGRFQMSLQIKTTAADVQK